MTGKNLSRGDTNRIRWTASGTVVKEFSSFSIPVAVHTVGTALLARPTYLGPQRRLNREIEVRKRLDEIGLAFPRIVDKGERSIEMEYLDYPGIWEAVEQGTVTPGDAGKLVGEYMADVRAAGFSIGDCDLDNFILGDELYALDFEIGDEEDSVFDLVLEESLLLMSILSREPGRASSFLTGLQDSYRPGKKGFMVAVLLAAGYSILMRQDVSMLVNVIVNTYHLPGKFSL
ncbi:MAG: hypothetical protein ABEJ91_01340 [Candidatus Nanohaloarchaea archaeon]